MNNERGFTLIEALVATLVLTIGLVATAQLLAVSLRMHQIGRNSTAATRLAQDKFEELMKLQFSNPAIQVNATDTLASNVPNYNDTPANSGYTRRWRVEAGPGANPSLRIVTIRIVPSNPNISAGGNFTMTTVIRSW